MSPQVMPRLHLDYWRRLTDDTGIFQHAKFAIPDRHHGYTTDDNARALVAAVMWYRSEPTTECLSLISTYLAFVYHAQNEDGSFKNFMNYDRRFIEAVGSEDSFGRALWAIGYTQAECSLPDHFRYTSSVMLSRSLAYAQGLSSPRAKGYALIGLSQAILSADWPQVAGTATKLAVKAVVDFLGDALVTQYQAYRQTEWHWFEDSLTYGNAVLPWSLFKASEVCARSDWREVAQESLAFLDHLTLSPDGYFKPIGCQGWMVRGGTAALYDEQPIEAAEMVMAFQAAYQSLRNERDRHSMERCYQWYLGKNSRGLPMIDPNSWGCYDGIERNGLNLNQGSESILSYLIAHMAMIHG